MLLGTGGITDVPLGLAPETRLISLKKTLTAHPINQFKKNPRFYLMYDGFWLVVCSALLVLMFVTGFRPVLPGPGWWYAPVFVLLVWAIVWAQVTVHNCTHGNLPRSINRLVGEVLGLIILVRFASWDIVHMRHHKYSDDRERDPHPNFPSFWKTVTHTFVNVEIQLQQQYFDTWGDTPAHRRFERFRAWVSYGTNVVLIACWVWLLGPVFFLAVFFPANVLGALFIIHFNWSTHNGEAATGIEDMHPVNLNHGYYAWGNRLFCGIYAHLTHHERPYLFNPARQTNFAAVTRGREQWEQAA